ncbi:glycosyltransferase [Nitrosovibrio tenuis]|uniref:Methyltransferase domain-containing protein n=1 Tax=Nitrosovibrio tenuis TaxID=1233 RepID=A0A1H7JZZ8_9PROT|nr:glycosyltransferase [Nitrosovibrio tenuis]SEK80251.1 Methyltransferase domain-containing protein [Nitrosovibrio tenuis]
MRILITNNTLDTRAGSELYVRDIALALLRRGHQPIAYSTRLGTVANELRAATIPVIDDLRLLTVAPDIIHGQHHMDAMTAMLHFPQTPAVYFCHGWLPWEEMAPHFPTIQRYVAVDDLCRERLQCMHGVSPEHIRMIRNFVDLQRFTLRDDLPAAPRRAVVFSNYVSENGCLGILRQACATRGIELDAIGLSVGRSEARPERILGQYDIVFAKARCALEALACGTGLIACDAAGLGGMVTPGNYDKFRALNFGIRTLRDPITVETVTAELDRYDASGAREVAQRARSEAGMEQAIDQIIHVYQEAIDAQHRTPVEKNAVNGHHPDPRFHAASDYLRQIADFTKGRHLAEHERERARAEVTTQRLRAEQAELALARIYNSRVWPVVTALSRLKHAVWNRPLTETRTHRRHRADQTKRADHGNHDAPSGRAKVFGQIYRNNSWQNSESRSGPGSTLERTEALRRELPSVLTRLGVRTLVDAPCGDCNWRQHVEIDVDAYIGVDIVPALIEENRRRYQRANWKFEVADLINDPLPPGDAVLCRDALIHLSLADIEHALSNIRRSGAKYLLATSHETISVNTDITTGEWRSVNLMLAPFNLPVPLTRIVENPQTGKILGVWSLAEL